jgi:glucose/arabinose dehydrogenase
MVKTSLAAVVAAAGLALAGTAQAYDFVPVAHGFASPVYITASPDDPGTLYVVERAGVIRIVRDGVITGTLLDIHEQVWADGEGGLLSLAFSPGYATNRLFYIDYTDLDRNTHVVEYRTAPDGTAVLSSARQLLFVQQVGSFPNHKGGQLAFDAQGRLYVGMGDGGSDPNSPLLNDPLNHGQDLTSQLGKLLRVDPLHSTTWKIVAYGLRNPWRFSFDNGNIWIADVGAGNAEEVDFIPKSRVNALTNFGWSHFEGTRIYNRKVKLQGKGKLTGPIYVYPHSDTCAIVGGYVYRGSAVPAARGRYFYGDYCSGAVWSFKTGAKGRAGSPTRASTIEDLVSFGRIGNELYAVSVDGTVYALHA